ncbi:glycosyltransferase family 4 protein [Thermococcus sp. 21S7]|uniref:glycosyltransferase family 4 protein n=1 Tax=Thermococcus sp. 21S7 TaxID=1638221 RepID=UPI00143A0FFE|nr:glycosyltransferase family 4 protein [Thermococcus sp. 21S7]NJE61208.1 glycosyltransferase family 1 protein [Thermococcus sp. 21S7]
MESLKIALASDWFFPSVGGVEYHIHDLATRLVEMGHEVHVITGPGDFPDHELPYFVHRFRGRLTLENVHVSIGTGMLKEVNELYKRENFDITHGHSVYSPIAVGVSNLSSGIRGVPSLITDHSFLGDSPMNPINIALLRLSLQKVDGFIAVSRAVENDLRSILGRSLGDREIHTIPNGIDTGFWRPAGNREEKKEELGLNGLVITTTSRLTKRKRIHVIPLIAARLETREDVNFVIIGDGPERGNIERLIRRYGVDDRVRLVGKLPRENVRDYLQATDVYFSPTIYEAFGIAALEALACGVPVVANNHGGISEVVRHGETGLVSQDDAELLRNLEFLLENPEVRRAMGRRARKSVEEEFSWEVVVKNILRVYRLTIERGPGEPFVLYRLHQAVKRGIGA